MIFRIKRYFYYYIIRNLYYNILAPLSDRLQGVDFAKTASSQGGEGMEIYQSTAPWMLFHLRKYLTTTVEPTDAIIDIGCGKGKMLKFFARFPFQSVCGLEYSTELCDIAVKNMKKLHIDCNIFCGDARNFNKINEFNYFFLYNPFNESIFSLFINNICSSLEEFPRTIRIIYLNPVCHDILIDKNFIVENELNGFSVKVMIYRRDR